MGSVGDATDPDAVESEEFRRAVPARAVLTELARGFLLVHESNPDRAVRFATTFLREFGATASTEPAGRETAPTLARRQLGRLPRGAVDPSNFPASR